MKHCPQCLNVYADESLIFCGGDGSRLIAGASEASSFLSSPVSPSEVALLCADQLGDVTGVSTSRTGYLSIMMMTAMVLSNEQVGYVRLQLEPRGKLLLHSNRLRVSAGAMNRRWPQWSMEDKFCSLLAQMGTGYFDDLIYALWGRNFRRNLNGAWRHGRVLVMEGLAARGLIRISADWKTYEVHESLAGSTSPQAVLPLRQMFIETMQRRPDVWAAIPYDIHYGVIKRAQGGGLF